MTDRRLVADVGGTWSRFAVSDGPGHLAEVRSYRTAARPTFAETLASYVADIGAAPAQSWCGSVHIAAAGPVDDGDVKLTNSSWRISTAEVSRDLGGIPVGIVNDLAAVGLLLPHLTPTDLKPVGAPVGGELVGNRIAVNVGTGFGAATAIRIGDDAWTVAPAEAGHMSLAGVTPEEVAVFAKFETIEDVLSGAGLMRLYAAVARRSGADAPPGEVPVFARIGEDPIAKETLDLMTRLLGRVCGDLALATASWDGVYLCGSVANAWAEAADTAVFRAAFESKGAMRPRMAGVPAHIIVTSHPALLGLTHGC